MNVVNSQHEQQYILDELHKTELELLRRFVDICNANNITYYIIGGTLLGAVRHGGFIPWDDDIDVAVPRDDYYRLIKVMRKIEDDDIGLLYYRDNPNLYFYPAKVISKKYRIQDVRMKDGFSYPWIDVLPIDGRPDKPLKYRMFKLRMDYYRLLLGLYYIDNLRDIKRSLAQRIVIKAGKVLRIGKYVNPTKVKDKIDRTLSSNRIEDCSWVGTCMGAYYFHEFVPKWMFGKGSTVRFCDMEVNAPELIDPYLRHMYGDYMTPPEEKDRQAVHTRLLDATE